ncbi:unnamed protein product [Amoebophrya sp. A120]|nr:unnamed protein product [Amoebophrya sp. A120]|eukprot:GSA120T00002583001.1
MLSVRRSTSATAVCLSLLATLHESGRSANALLGASSSGGRAARSTARAGRTTFQRRQAVEPSTSPPTVAPAPTEAELTDDVDYARDAPSSAEAYHRAVAPPDGRMSLSPQDAARAAQTDDALDHHHVSADFDPASSFVGATCAQICSEQCIPKTVGEEFTDFAGVVGHKLSSLIPDSLEKGVEAVGDYVTDVGKALAAQKRSFLQRSARTTTTTSEILKTKNHSSDCQARCETLVDRCSDLMDSSDRIPERAEDVAVDPAVMRCQDMAKLQFIAKHGNVKYSTKFGVPPTFSQLASLTEPMDQITEADLRTLSVCADGGDDASLNLGGSLQLLDCMVAEANAYAHQIQRAVASAPRKNATKIASEAMLAPPKTMKEDLFFVNDVRCYQSKCGPKFAQTTVKTCEKDGVCSTDFGHLLWQLGLLHTESPMMRARKEMVKHHVAEQEDRLDEFADSAGTVADADRDGKDDLDDLDEAGLLDEEEGDNGRPTSLASSRSAAAVRDEQKHGTIKPEPRGPGATLLQAEVDETDPDHQRALKDAATSFTPPPFCRAQMCAPFPLTTLTEVGLAKLFSAMPGEKCPVMEKIADSHPHDLYDGMIDEPKGSISDDIAEKVRQNVAEQAEQAKEVPRPKPLPTTRLDAEDTTAWSTSRLFLDGHAVLGNNSPGAAQVDHLVESAADWYSILEVVDHRGLATSRGLPSQRAVEKTDSSTHAVEASDEQREEQELEGDSIGDEDTGAKLSDETDQRDEEAEASDMAEKASTGGSDSAADTSSEMNIDDVGADQATSELASVGPSEAMSDEEDQDQDPANTLAASPEMLPSTDVEDNLANQMADVFVLDGKDEVAMRKTTLLQKARASKSHQDRAEDDDDDEDSGIPGTETEFSNY